MTPAILALATELLKFAVSYGLPAAVAFAESLSEPEPSIEDIVTALRRAHKSADEYLQTAKEELQAQGRGQLAASKP